MPLPGYAYFVFLAGQILAYPLLAGVLHRLVHGVSRPFEGGNVSQDPSIALQLKGVSKVFGRTLFDKLRGIREDNLKAVDNLSLSITRGHLLCLLGINWSGKSALIGMITGAKPLSSGAIGFGRHDSIGLCPQVNVAWSDLTVYENVRLISQLKSGRISKSRESISALVSACDLDDKANEKPSVLCGGQKRKLQLALAFAGGSSICFIDEASSGLDPLSRRKIWDILRAERGKRTIILTTLALDEADTLSDDVAIMAAGRLIAQGSSAALKDLYGGGYKINIERHDSIFSENSAAEDSQDDKNIVITAMDSSHACEVAQQLEKSGIKDFSVHGPSMEDVFLNLAQQSNPNGRSTISTIDDAQTGHIQQEQQKEASLARDDAMSQSRSPGNGTTLVQQLRLFLAKRVLAFRRNWLPYVFALAVPITTAALGAYYFLAGFNGIPCSRGGSANNPRSLTLPALEYYWGIEVPVGPAERFSMASLPAAYIPFRNRIHLQDNFADFDSYIRNNFRDVAPGGCYLGNDDTASPLMAYRINGSPGYAALAKNLADSYLMNTTINDEFSTFALPFTGSTGDSLQLIPYLGLALSVFPAFFSLYPTFERLTNVRALHYSRGARPASLWLAYLSFDAVSVIVVAVVVTPIFASVSLRFIVGIAPAENDQQLSSAVYAPAYLFVAFMLYEFSSTLLAYVVTLCSRTQLAAFATIAGFQATSLLIYFIM